MIHSKEEEVPNHRDVHKYTSPTNPRLSSATASKRPRNIDAWMCPVSKKCKQTVNPVQSIVAQVARRIRPAAQRSDRKTPRSLAVSTKKQWSATIFILEFDQELTFL
jgi:hypothetical protein